MIVNTVRILYYVPLLRAGGTEKQLLYLVQRLDRERFAPAVWCSDSPGPLSCDLKVLGIPHYYEALRPERSLVERIARWLEELRITIFHSLNYFSHSLEVLCARLAHIPVVVTSRRNTRYWDPKNQLQPWEERRNRLTDLVVANCHAAASLCRQIEGVPNDRIRVVHNGVLAAATGARAEIRAELGLASSDLLVGNVANLRAVKGHAILLRAFQLVLEQFPNAQLAICGDGPARESVYQLQRDLNLTKQVHFLGVRQDMNPVYGAFDLYAHASLSEGLPNAVLEAMTHGLAVVATDAGGTREAVANQMTGLLVPPGDPYLLARAIELLLKDPEARQRMGEAGRARATSMFDMESMVRSYEGIYAELLRKRQESLDPLTVQCSAADRGSD